MPWSTRSTLYMTLLAVALTGCASDNNRVVEVGDKVGMHFTCRLPNGELAVSTDPDAGKSAPASSIYLTRYTSDPLIVVAGDVKKNQSASQRTAFEEDVAGRLAATLAGVKEGATISADLAAERIEGLPENEQFIKLAKVRKRAKELRMTREAFKARTGKDAEVDQPYVIDPAVPGKVVAITDDEVLIHFNPVAPEITLPFGKGIIRETAGQYEIDIQAVPGTLVRSGGLIGRISSVDNEMFTMDYGHPFGGEKLRCDVTVASITRAEKKEPTPVSNEKRDVSLESVSAVASSSGKTLDPQARKVFNDALTQALSKPGQPVEVSLAARNGDVVTINYTATLEDGALVSTTVEKTAKDQAVKKVAWFVEPARYTPLELVAGKQEIMPGLAEALVGMRSGETKRIVLTPDKAFGMPDTQKTQQLPCSHTFPKTIRMPADEYVKRFSTFPVLNKEVELIPYFKSRVTEVTERDVALEFMAADGASFNDSFGVVGVAVAGDKITTTLKPLLGAPFQFKEGAGLISATDGKTFTVDLNNPLAGKTIVLELEVVSVAPAVLGPAIDWADDHDAGLARAKKEGKPLFLILHADWCGWCKKTFTETIPDPRIMALKDRFVWVRVNSDKEQKYKEEYGQDGFPMVVLLSADGAVLKKIDGYRDALALLEEMKAVLN